MVIFGMNKYINSEGIGFFCCFLFFWQGVPTFLLQTIKLELVATNVRAVLASQDAGSPIKLIPNFPSCRNGLTKRQGCEKPTSNCLPQNNVQERRHLGGCELISFYWLLNWPSRPTDGRSRAVKKGKASCKIQFDKQSPTNK